MVEKRAEQGTKKKKQEKAERCTNSKEEERRKFGRIRNK